MDGISFEFTDKRVDKLIKKQGFKDSEIFYSPLNVWLALCGFLLVISIPFMLEFLFNFFSKYSVLEKIIIASIYPLFCYVIVMIYNRSFAITDKELLIINSHFPFSSVKSFNLDEISEVKISHDKKLQFLLFFGFFQTNYIQVKINDQELRFYCLFLDVDCYDENFTKKTLDDLAQSLHQKMVNVSLEI